jgi:hypothetical protein
MDCTISKSYPLCPRNTQNWQEPSLMSVLKVPSAFCHSAAATYPFHRWVKNKRYEKLFRSVDAYNINTQKVWIKIQSNPC